MLSPLIPPPQHVPEEPRATRLNTAVTLGSTAAQCGLEEGDEIIALNGGKVAGMDGEISSGKRLFDLLANQPAGQMLDVDVIVRTTKKVTLRATSN